MPWRSDNGRRLLVIMVVLLVTGCASRTPVAPPPDDTALSRQVQEAVERVQKELAPDPRLAVFEVTTTVRQGRATMHGRVLSEGLKDELRRAITGIAGIKGIDDQLLALPNPALGAKRYALANRAAVNLGLKPGEETGKSLATQAALGEILEIVDENNGWYLVKMWDGYLGWVNGSNIVRLDKDELERYRAGPYAEILAKSAALREQPGGKVLMQAVQGVSLPLRPTPTEDGQVEVALPDGRRAWVAQADVHLHQSTMSIFATPKGIEAVIATAQQYVGLPYLWGGTTSLGFDCSGFTQFALRVNGYPVPRDADQQFSQGEALTRADLKRGDLVFFSTYKAGPSHMGIYLGDGEFIHSSGSLGVAISSLNPNANNYVADLDMKFLAGRRIIR